MVVNMGRPAKHDERSRDAVLDAAEALLAAGGPEAVTVRAVASEVGESTRVVYSQFASMAALMGSLGARGFQMVADLVNQVPTTDKPLDDLIEVGAGAFRQFAIDYPHLFRITFHQISSEITQQPDAREALQAAYASLAVRFEHAIDHGALPPRPVIEYAFAFHSFTSGLAANELSMQPPPVGASFWTQAHDINMDTVWRTAIGSFIRGLADSPTQPDRRHPSPRARSQPRRSNPG